MKVDLIHTIMKCITELTVGKPKHSADGLLKPDDWKSFQSYDFVNGDQMTRNEVLL